MSEYLPEELFVRHREPGQDEMPPLALLAPDLRALLTAASGRLAIRDMDFEDALAGLRAMLEEWGKKAQPPVDRPYDLLGRLMRWLSPDDTAALPAVYRAASDLLSRDGTLRAITDRWPLAGQQLIGAAREIEPLAAAGEVIRLDFEIDEDVIPDNEG